MSDRYLPDPTGHFPIRRYYDIAALELEAEQRISGFLKEYTGAVEFPISTDLLTLLIDRDASDLDLYAELGDEVHGVTEFCRGNRPTVKISRALTEQPARLHRLRTTLTHEYAHVWLHDPLFQFDHGNLDLFEHGPEQTGVECLRDSMLGSPVWYEWQAGYLSGALLMPISALRAEVIGFRDRHHMRQDILYGSTAAQDLTGQVSMRFGVSVEAARVRLQQRQVLVEARDSQSLFGRA